MGIDKDKNMSTENSDLRRQSRAKTAKSHSPRTLDETHRLAQGIEVHQVEL